MAVKIRLRRIGSRHQPFYRVVVADSSAPRDGAFLETIGHYNPRTNPASVDINADRALAWLGKGAQPTDTARSLLRKCGVLARYAEVRRAAKAEAAGKSA